MEIRFFGVRGSVPSPGPETAGVGGNTSCVEVTTRAGRSLVLDAGTGMRRLGNELLRRGAVDVDVLLSHVHWDHIQGIPFFAPIFMPGTQMRFFAGHNGVPLRDTLRRQMSAPTFPVDLGDLPSKLSFTELRDRSDTTVGDARVRITKANHPDAVFAYRIDVDGGSVVYATDTEHYSCVDGRLAALAEGADVLIYDAQYLPEEYAGERGMSRIGWGHSTYEAGCALADAAGARKLVLFHHDPSRDDAGVEEIEERARRLRSDVVAAREGTIIVVEGARVEVAA